MIHKQMTIESIFEAHPEKGQLLGQEMTNAGLHCVGCGAATWETLEAGMLSHGFSDEQIDALIVKLNDILNQKTDPNTISVTPKAARKFLEILEDEDKKGWALRLGLKAGGCSGYEYLLDFSEKATADDQVFHSEGIDIHISTRQVGKMMGCVVDFVDGLYGSGFKISNPNVKGSCGCGKSQSY